MHRRSIVRISRCHAVHWPCAARLRDAGVAHPPRRYFYPSLSRLNSSDDPSSSNSDATTDSSSTRPTPKFGPRWASRSTQSALSPEEQAVRDALRLKPASHEKSQQQQQQQQQGQPEARSWQKWQRPSIPQQPATLSPEEQTIRDSLLFNSASQQREQGNQKLSGSWQRFPGLQNTRHSQTPRGPRQDQQKTSANSKSNAANLWRARKIEPPFSIGDKKSEALQPRKEYEVAGPGAVPRKLRDSDWVCPDCGFTCFGKHMTCPMCKARRPVVRHQANTILNRGTDREVRPGDWICPGCGHRCFGKHMFCPRCNTRDPNPSAEAVSHAEKYRGTFREQRPGDWLCPGCRNRCFARHTFCPRCKTRNPRPYEDSENSHFDTTREPRSNTVRDLRFDPSAESGGGTIGESIKIRRTALSHDLETGDRSSDRKAALEKHLASRFDPEDEMGELGLRRHRRAKFEKSGRTERETDLSSDRLKSRDKKPKRQGGYRESGAEVDEFDVDEYHHRREERKKQKKERSRQKQVEPELSPLYLPEFISVSNFADVVGMRPAQFVERMEEMGFEDVSYSHVLDAETAGLIATEFGYEPIFDTGAEQDLTAAPEPEDKSIWPTRPPVVTIMGHVDHGKTTILDWLRESSVAASEHGGITQHIGAFSVSMPSGKKITFLDTPGHAAFLDMRRRGADVTDIVVLVVAADDSVKPQTVEAIKHATSAKVPIIVAISKIDKEGIHPEKVKQDLSAHGIYVEDYGGDVQAIGVSGKTGLGMLELEEAIVTLSEVLDHRADANGSVEGWVIEGTTKSYGRVATVLVRRGTLRPGDILVAGSTWARVRTLRNEAGISISEATPGTPVEIDGWRDQPTAGTELLQAGDEQHAKDVVEYRLEREENQKLGEDTTAINEARRDMVEKRKRESGGDEESAMEEKSSGPKAVNFVLKADVDGSAEAVLNSITAIGNNEVYAKVLRSEVGPVSESDVELAAASSGHLVCFNMPIDAAMSRMAESLGVNIMDHNVIYKLVDDVKDTLSEQLAPTVTHRVTGEAEIGQIFEISLKSRVKTSIAGCKVRNGMINRTKKVRVLRGQETIYDGSISSLKNVKKDVTEMRKDTECGIAFEDWTGFAVGDQIQCYEEIFEKRHL